MTKKKVKSSFSYQKVSRPKSRKNGLLRKWAQKAETLIERSMTRKKK